MAYLEKEEKMHKLVINATKKSLYIRQRTILSIGGRAWSHA